MRAHHNRQPGKLKFSTLSSSHARLLTSNTLQAKRIRRMTQDWAQPINRWHKLYAANSDIKGGNGHQIVTAYAVKRPDQRWAMMLALGKRGRRWPSRPLERVPLGVYGEGPKGKSEPLLISKWIV